MVIALRHHEQQARVGRQRETGFGRGGHEIEIDTDGAHHNGVSCRRARDVAFAQPNPRTGRGCRFEAIDVDAPRIVAQRPPQPPLRHQLVERMWSCVRTAVLLHDRHHTLESVSGRKIAVQHRGELAVGLTDADLETTLRDARHLETAQLAGEVIVFGDDLEPRVLEKEPKLGSVVRRRGRRKRLGIRRVKLSSSEPPDRRRVGEECGPTSEHTGVVLDEEMQFVQPVLPAPSHRLAERPGRVALDEQPSLCARRPGRASRKGSRHGGLDVEVGAHEGGELRLQQRPTALGFERVERNYDDFLRRP